MHNIYGDFKLHLTDELACFLVNKYCIKRVLSFRDIMVAQVVFCKNLRFANGIRKKRLCKCFLGSKTYQRLALLTFLVAWTMFSITPITLSRSDKMAVSETLPPRFTMKITSLNIGLLKCYSEYSTAAKIQKKGPWRSMVWSQGGF